MHLHVRGDESGSEFCISGSSCTTAADGFRNVVYLEDEVNIKSLQGMLDRTFSQFLSATIGPSVARVSAPRTSPSLKRHPTIVVPVLVALGNGRPFSVKKLFLQGGLCTCHIQAMKMLT